MKPGIPWSVKGIGSDAREAAKHAARRSGMTLGEWLNSVILDSSEEPAQEPARPRGGDLSAQLGDLAQQLARLSQQPPPAPPEPDPELTSELLARIDSTERQAAEAFTVLNDRLVALGRQVSEAPKPPNLEDNPSYRALEGALRNVVDHIEVSEKRTRDSLKTMQERLAGMAHRAAQAESEAVAHSAPAITRLETRLAGMAERLERAEASAQHGIPVIVQSELVQLAERIESVKTSSDTAVQRAQSAAQTAAQREVREVEGRIHKLLHEAQTAMRGAAGAGAELQSLRGEVEGLAQRFDDLKADAASERDLHALRLAIEQLSARIAQGPDLRPLGELDRKLADLTRRLEQNQADPRLAAQLGDLDTRVYELDRRLADMMQRRDDGRATAALEAQIAAIADRITGTEQQLGHLSSIERTVSQLYDGIEQTRSWAKDVAEDAAGRMAERLAQMQPQHGTAAELRALEDGLAAVRAGATATERRNQETLEAVHETLEQIVDRLAEMESRPQPPAYQPPPQPAPAEFAFEPPWRTPSPAPQSADFAAPAATEQRIPPFASVPPQQPVTPDFSAMPAPDEGPFPRDDFIAAARRAAQAAAQRQIHPVAGLGLIDKAKRKGLGFRLPRLAMPFSGRKPERVAGPAYAVKAENGKSRTLILASLALIAAASAYSYTSYRDRSTPPPAPPAEQQTAPKAQPESAEPPRPRPADNDTGMPAPATLSPNPGSRKSSAIANDMLLTGALPRKQDATLTSIVAEPGMAGPAAMLGMPPPEAGPEALRQAAAAGNAAAQFVIASRYLDGKEIERDFTQAARWYQAAANAGLAPAQYRIATLFERGRGVPKDLLTARLWYERAGGRGNVKAMHNAAVIFAGAQVGEPDYDKAAHWFTEAARHGLKDSQFNLAVLHERGLGVPRDPAQALFWYTLAGRQDDADAAKKAQELGASLPAGDIKSVKDRLLSWKAEAASPEANVVSLADPPWQASGDRQPPAPQGGTDDVVLRAQQLLAGLGFDIGQADGRMGARTANAIRLFQVQQGLTLTGQATPELIAKLEAKRG